MHGGFLCNRKLRSYYTKTLREDAQFAVRKISLCEPLARGESRKQDSFLLQGSVMEINEKDRVTERVSAALSFLMKENMLHYISVLENESERSSGYE